MYFQYLHVPSQLKNFVRNIWILHVNNRNPDRDLKTFRIVADGHPGMIFQYGPDHLSIDGEYSAPLPALSLYGQSTRFGNLSTPGKIKCLGIRFYPHALKSVFGFSASEITDDLLDLDLIKPRVSEKLAEARSTDQRIEMLTSFVSQLTEQYSGTDYSIQKSALALIESKGNIPLPVLHKKLQISERQFERRFKQSIGLTPVLFSRICRFQAAFQQVRSGSYQKLSDIAFDNNYSDQSHFIREFREFSGFKPGSYRFSSQDIIEICQ